ncbi:MAG TPA: hypothetical protein DCS63_04040 [Elusimicrobia bacterium]|nr:hypothetical protein [Elusimicrobiota bacterium]
MKTLKTTLALATIISTAAPFLSAQDVRFRERDYFTVAAQAVTLTAVEPGREATPPAPSYAGNISGMSKAAPGGGLMNAGMAAWSVINSGAPSGSYSSTYASAIPGFAFNWGNITGWKGPKEMIYRYKVTNMLGRDVIDVKYKISFFYGGTEDYSGQTSRLSGHEAQAAGRAAGEESSEAKVHGRYITNFTVQPVSVDVKWGWHYDLTVKMSDPMNIGTKLNPVAALQASLNWIVSTTLATEGGTLTYNVDGLGNFKDLNQREKGVSDKMGPIEPLEIPAISWN